MNEPEIMLETNGHALELKDDSEEVLQASPAVLEEILIEEISIDGMCGVY